MIDVWFTSVTDSALDPLLERYAALLSEQECQRETRYVREQDRRRFLVSRALLRCTLSRYAPVQACDWQFGSVDLGKPCVEHPDPEVRQLGFSLSHAGDQIVLAVSPGRRLGLDIEWCRPRPGAVALARHYFLPSEWHSLQALPREQQYELFAAYWTLKEARTKLDGQGILTGLSRYGFDLSTGGLIRPLDASVDDVGRCAANACWLGQWRCSNEALLALCAQGGELPTEGPSVNMYRVRPLLDEAPEPSILLRRSGVYAIF